MSWNKNKTEKSVAKRRRESTAGIRRRMLTLAIAASLLVGVMVAVRLWVADGPQISKPQREKARPALPVVKRASQKAAEQNQPAPEVEDPKKQIDPGYLTGINPKLPPKKYLPTIEEVEKARLGPDGKPRRQSIYKTPIEQALGTIFTTPLGYPPPPLPSIPSISSQEQLEKFFDTPIEYDKNASRETNENRIMMSQVRDEFRRYLDEGGKAKDFVSYYVEELRTSYELRRTAQKMLVDMSRSGEDAQSLRNFRDKANAILAEKGIRSLAVPPSVRQAMGEE